MKISAARWVLAGVLITAFLSNDAAAWGPKAKRSITGMAMQMIKHDYPYIFRPGESNFEPEVIEGCLADRSLFLNPLPLNNDEETIEAVAAEIQLLRDVRPYGPTSYFAFRMGSLAGLTADVMIPFGFAWSPEEVRTQSQMNRDIDAALDRRYSVASRARSLVFIRDARDYFEKHRPFFDEDKLYIAADYQRGTRYDGHLSNGGPKYFVRSIEAVADAWHTVLQPQGVSVRSSSSKLMMTWYFVDEIRYLLKEKRNFQMTHKVYANFESVNPGLVEAHELIGDYYYAFGTEESIERGVREWRRAHSMAGTTRQRIGNKLAAHYMQVGQKYLASAENPGAPETDLQNALQAFQEALKVKGGDKAAADSIQLTQRKIAEREERFRTMMNVISMGDTILEEADKARTARDYGNSIKTYMQAVGVFEAVDEEFPELYEKAASKNREIERSISDVVNEILDSANDVIAEGDQAKETRQYQQAINSYEKVPGIVAAIPDVNPTVTEDKNSIIELASSKVEEAKLEKMRFEASQQGADGNAPGEEPF